MALAYALGFIESNGLAKITNYGEFFELESRRARSGDLRRAPSWSCVHGVGRWSCNCSCNSGGHGDWNQEMARAVTRRAGLAARRGSSALRKNRSALPSSDPWAARNDYIDVILGPPSPGKFGAFRSLRHFRRKNLQRAGSRRGLEKLPGACSAFTPCSCTPVAAGSSMSFLELKTVQVIQYAGRCVVQQQYGN